MPVIYHVVGILVGALYLIVTCGIVAIEVSVERDMVSLHQSASGVGEQTLSEDTVLQGDVAQRSLVVGIDGEGLVQTP